jgi:glutathione synthase/RimK-type ligase-like ATP-grasp enzyme
MKTIKQNSYYLGLYDLDIVDHNDINGRNIYKKVDWRKSGNQEYFIMIDKKLQERGNWHRLNDKQVLNTSLIDFCFSNWCKLQTNSVIHNRILLDTCHFISNKVHYYETFKEFEFIPSFLNITDTNLLEETINEKLILKPATGSLSLGIKIFDNKNTKKDIIQHLNRYKQYTNWILSPIYIAKKWTDGCILSNRIYYLVRKFKVNNKLYITGYWFDEFIHYKTSRKYDENETDYNIMKHQLITNEHNGEIDAAEFFFKRVLTHEQYLSLFTKDEYNKIKVTITKYLNSITQKISEHLTCSNDYLDNLNDDTGENKNMSFHLYGIDSLIMDDLTIKFIEINGAPSIIYDAAINHIDYSVIINEILKLTTDVLYPPKNQCEQNYTSDKVGPKYGYFKDTKTLVKLFDRKFIECGEFTKILKTPIYIARQIDTAYPFITNALFSEKRKQIYQRIKNPHSNDIFLFYGLRDRYFHNKSSLNFYDEIIEYRISSNSQKAKILNKIQGITYYLASKDRLYYACGDKDYIPKSIIFNVDTDKTEILNTFMEMFKSNKTTLFIVKPVYGSQGKGIIIMSNNSNIETFITNMMLIKKQFGYNIFIISIYIDNPKLYTDSLKFKNNIKFNLRFYSLLHINKLATYDNNVNDINYYILNDVQIYFSVLPYNVCISEVPIALLSILNTSKINDSDYMTLYDKIKSLSISNISNLINLTNLQMVKNLSTYLNTDIPLNNFVMTLNEMNYDNDFKNNIVQQGYHIINDTINSIKHNIRHLNRFVNDSTAFNLIAYDTMIDDENKLHLIEINRGPDLHGLKLTLGENKITDVFSELFDIVIDGKSEEELKHFKKYELEY